MSANQIGILEWSNEAILSYYPFVPYNEAFPKNTIVEAHFVQFDNFIPHIVETRVTPDAIEFDFMFDGGVQLVTSVKNTFVVGDVVTFRDAVGSYIGFVKFGEGMNTLWAGFSQKFKSLYFLPFTTRSIPSRSGVYALDGYTGDVVFSDTDSVFYGVDGNDVTFNAVAAGIPIGGPYLKTINGLSPVNNTFYINDSDLIRIQLGISQLTFSTSANLLDPIFI